MASEGFQDFLVEVQKQAQANIVLFAGQLALLFAQLKTVYSIDSLFLKSVVSATVLAFLVGLYHAYKSKELVTFLLIKERQRAAGGKGAEGYSYVRWAQEIYSKSGVDLDDEESAVEVGRRSMPWIIGTMLAGYIGLGVILIAIIWGTPS